MLQGRAWTVARGRPVGRPLPREFSKLATVFRQGSAPDSVTLRTYSSRMPHRPSKYIPGSSAIIILGARGSHYKEQSVVPHASLCPGRDPCGADSFLRAWPHRFAPAGRDRRPEAQGVQSQSHLRGHSPSRQTLLCISSIGSPAQQVLQLSPQYPKCRGTKSTMSNSPDSNFRAVGGPPTREVRGPETTSAMIGTRPPR